MWKSNSKQTKQTKLSLITFLIKLYANLSRPFEYYNIALRQSLTCLLTLTYEIALDDKGRGLLQGRDCLFLLAMSSCLESMIGPSLISWASLELLSLWLMSLI